MLQFIAISVTPFAHVLQINLVTQIAIYNLQPACHTSKLSGIEMEITQINNTFILLVIRM
jgi:hypothetical protein